MSKQVVIIGGGYGGLSAASYLARDGYKVTLLEKNDHVGGRGMVMHDQGFTFDMGPSWYMMPDVFEEFFSDFGKKVSDYYDLVQLNPSYKVFFDNESFNVHAAPKVFDLFEQLEPGSSKMLKKLLTLTKEEYLLVRCQLLQQPMTKLSHTLRPGLAKFVGRPEALGSYHSRIKRYVKDERLQKILEFMVVFLGGSPQNIPALYTLLAYVDMGLGIHYPMGGMHTIAKAYESLAKEQGADIQTNVAVKSIQPAGKHGYKVHTKNGTYSAEIVVANADYHHVQTKLLGDTSVAKKWDKTVMSPSALLLYIGVNKKIPNLRHHNLFFDVDWDNHFNQVFKDKVWSNEPLFYVGAPSRTDSSVAPKGHENIFVLAPMASGLNPTKSQIDKTTHDVLARLSKHAGVDIPKHTVVMHTRSHDYFAKTFNAFQGTAFGPAHTLKQSTIFRSKMYDKRNPHLYYVGQYTNPGTGVPLVTISGKAVAELIRKQEQL